MNDSFTASIYSNLRSNFIVALEKNDRETIFKLLNFLHDLLFDSILHKSLPHFHLLHDKPAEFYSETIKKRNKGVVSSFLCSDILKNIVKNLRGQIEHSLGFQRNNASLEYIDSLNIYFQYSFLCYSRILYISIQNNDIDNYTEAIEELNAISTYSYDANQGIISKISILRGRENFDKHKYEIEDLNNELQIRQKVKLAHRQIYLVIRYWGVYLFSIGVLINEELLTKIINTTVQSFPAYHSNDIKDVLSLGDQSNFYFKEIRNWDYQKRRSGVVYSSPNLSRWLALGFLIDKVSGNFFEPWYSFEDFSIEELNKVIYLHQTLLHQKEFILKDFIKWKNILGIEIKDELIYRIETLLKALGKLKRKKFQEEERDVANAKLAPQRIIDFIQEVNNTWNERAYVRGIFENLQIVTILENDYSGLEKMQQNLFLGKSKKAFLEGSDSNRFGSFGMIGEYLADIENNYFFRLIMEGTEAKESSSIVEGLNDAIQNLKRNDFTPDLIIISEQLYWTDSNFRGEIKTNINSDNGNIFLGTYSNISVYSWHVRNFQSRILVADSSSAFKMFKKYSTSSLGNELNVTLQEINDEEADSILKRDGDKWRIAEDNITLTDEEAITLIKTSVKGSATSFIKFEILNPAAYKIIKIDKNLENH